MLVHDLWSNAVQKWKLKIDIQVSIDNSFTNQWNNRAWFKIHIDISDKWSKKNHDTMNEISMVIVNLK